MKSVEQSGLQDKPEDGQVNSARQFYKKGGKKINMETVQLGDMARELGLIKDASIVTALVILLRNVELLVILLHAAENGILKPKRKTQERE